LFSYALLQVKTTGIAAQHDGNPLILPILGRQNPENKNYLENFLKSLKKRLTKQQLYGKTTPFVKQILLCDRKKCFYKRKQHS